MMPITDDSDEAVIEEEEEQAPVETEPLRAANSPVMPSAAEVEEHRLTHTATVVGAKAASAAAA